MTVMNNTPIRGLDASDLEANVWAGGNLFILSFTHGCQGRGPELKSSRETTLRGLCSGNFARHAGSSWSDSFIVLRLPLQPRFLQYRGERAKISPRFQHV